MTIYEFANSITDCENIVFTIFDCNKENLISIDTDDGEKTNLNIDELLYSDYDNYEIGGTDMWIENGKIHIEFNIDVNEEDEWE